MKNIKSRLIFILSVVFLISVYWIVDSIWSFISYEDNLKVLMYSEPSSYIDTLLLRVSPYQMVSRIIGVFIFIISGILIYELILKRIEIERRYYDLFHDSRDPTILLDKSTITDCNDAAISLFGLKFKEELIGSFLSNFASTIRKDEVDNCLETKIKECFNIGYLRFIWKYRDVKDNIFESEVTLAKPFPNQNVLQATIRNITDSKYLIKSLKESETRYSTLVETIPFGIQEIDLEGKIIRANRSVHKIFDSFNSDLVGKYVWEIPNTETERTKLKKYFFDYIRSEKPPQVWRGINSTSSGRRIEVEVHWDYIRSKDDNKIKSIACVIIDVTDRVRGERYQLAFNKILNLLNRSDDIKDTIHKSLNILRDHFNIRAASVRLFKNGDYPFYETNGLSAYHVDPEKGCVTITDDSSPNLNCLCGMVIENQCGEAPGSCTSYGTYWVNNLTEFINDRELFGNYSFDFHKSCQDAGYNSLCLIPLKDIEATFGLLQLFDRRKDVFDKDYVKFFEAIADSLSISLSRKLTQNRLEESESVLRSIFDAAPIGMGIINYPEREFVKVNNHFINMLGYTQEEIIGENALIIYPDKKEYDRVQEIKIRQVEKTGKGHVETKFKTKDGMIFEVLLSSAKVNDTNSVIFTALDITELLLVKEEVRKRERYFKALIENLLDGFLISNVDGKFIGCNHAAERILGYSSDELREMSFKDITPEKWIKWEIENINVKLENDGTTGFYEKEYIRKDGTIFPAEVCIYSIFGTDEIDGNCSFIRDITEKKQQERTIIDSENVFRTAFETIPDAVAINRQDDGRFIHLNEGYLVMSGYERSELIGGKSRKLWSRWEDRELMIDKIKKEGKLSNFEMQFVRKDGEVRDGLMSAASINLRDIPCTLTITRDITERKRRISELIEKERQLKRIAKMEAVGTLAGGVAHDFNNIIQIISGNVQLLMLDADADLKQKLNVMYDATVRGADLSRRLLTFSKNVESKLQPVDVNAEINLAYKLLDRSISGPVIIEFQLNLDPNLSLALADPTQLNQVITNLTINAKDAMPYGGHIIITTKNITLDETYCRQHPDCVPGDYILICFSDSGTGMSKEIQDRIFEPFFSTKDPGKGTGLGLAVVYGIIQSHNGHINVYSNLGSGTEFKVYLPKANKVDKEISIIEEPLPSGGGDETILIVDDEEQIRDISRDILERYGYNVLIASDGEEGFNVYKENMEIIDLVILDLVMPKKSGTEVLEEIKKINPNEKILIASGYSTNGPIREVLDRGAKMVVNKPYTLRELLSKVRDTLDDRGESQND